MLTHPHIFPQEEENERFSAQFSSDYVFEGIVVTPGLSESVIKWQHDDLATKEKNCKVGLEQMVTINHANNYQVCQILTQILKLKGRSDCDICLITI